MGTGSKLLLLASVTTVPPGGAVLFKLTVHAVPPPALKLDGLHARELSTAGGVPPPPATLPVRDIETVAELEPLVAVMVAALFCVTPFVYAAKV
jgi:hypothetical protein